MANATTVGQRFTELIAYLGVSKNAFATSLEKTATVIQHIVDERNKPGFDLLCKVFEIYPNVSKDWLLQGTGPMLASNSVLSPAPTTTRPVANLRAENQKTAVTTVAEVPAAETASIPAPPEDTSQTHAQSAPAVVAPVAVSPAAVPDAPIMAPAAAVLPPVAAATPDTSWQTALYTQQMAHQLAMAELRNQHLQEQQRMMQQMMDLMKQQMFK